jgi:hypothetical protein
MEIQYCLLLLGLAIVNTADVNTLEHMFVHQCWYFYGVVLDS